MADEKEMGVPFPVAGIDLSSEYGRQPPMTTPEASNVRGFDTLAERGRGGSRPGLTKFIDSTVNGVHVIQHLTVLVDPQEPALPIAGFDIPDPSDNGRNLLTDGSVRLVRRGGSGNRHLVNPGSPPRDRQQYAFGGQNNPAVSTPMTVVFDTTPKPNGYLIIFVATYATAFNFPTDPVNQTVQVTVKNGTGTNFSQIDGYTRIFVPSGSGPGFDTAMAISCWVLRATGAAADKTIVVTPDAGTASSLVAAEFSNISVPTPHGLLAVNGYDGSGGSVTFLSAGSIPVTQPHSILFGVFYTLSFGAFTAILDNGFLSPLDPTFVYQGFAELDDQSTSKVLSCNIIDTPASAYVAAGIALQK